MRAYNEAYQSGRMLKQKEKDERMRKKADQVKERLASLPSTSSTEIAEAPLMKDVLDLIRPAGASQDLLPLPDVHPTPIAAHNEVGQGLFGGDIHAPLLGLPQGGSRGSHSTPSWAAWFNGGR